jgi:hypothetical protein
MKKLIIVLFAVVAVFGMTSCKKSSPSSVVESYYKALQVPDYEKALSYTDITDQDELKSQLEKLEGFKTKVIDFEILSETIAEDGNSAVVEVKYNMTSSFNETPQEQTKKLNLVKVDGKWKIHA